MGRKNQASTSAYFGAKKKKDKPDSTSTVAVGTAATELVDLSIPRPSSCAGAYNSSSGKKKAVVSIYSKYIAPLTTHPFNVGKYQRLPAIVSKECTKSGVFNGLDGGMMCGSCKKLRATKGSNNPATLMNKWAPVLHRCEERKLRDVLTDSDLNDAKKFTKNANQQLTTAGMELKTEAQGQVAYGSYMAYFCKRLPPQSFKTIGEDSATGLEKFLVFPCD